MQPLAQMAKTLMFDSRLMSLWTHIENIFKEEAACPWL